MTDSLRTTLQDSLGSAYTLKAELGGGGMSRVFVAREEALGRDVVVKVLAPELTEGLSVERFAREIRLAASLQDPHIVPIHASGSTADGVPYYTMPFVQGASLRQRMDRGLMPRDDATRILRDVAQALSYAHERGIIHRDIKPENILLANGTAVVTDFGLAKALTAARTQADAPDAPHRITRTGMSLGTPAYMAPEQAAGDPDADQRADLYAWGMVAYEVLAGRHPFADRTSPQQMLAAQIVDVPRDLAVVADGLSASLAALVMQCLAKDAAHRPESAAALMRSLDGETRSAAHHANPRPTGRAIWSGVGVALTVIAGLAFAWRNGRVSSPQATAVNAATGPVMMAVLPFEHAGPADQQPFTDGLTDAVTAKLAKLSALMVIDRRSAATYRGTTKPAQQIGTELGVRYLLEGVVRWAKDGAGTWRARVTPTLVDAQSGAITWTGEPAEVTLDDPFTAQGSIATDVAAAMEVAVLPTERVELKRRFSDNAQAFAAYQAGRRLYFDSLLVGGADRRRLREKIAHQLETAIGLDSSFSAAWGLLAMHRIRIAVERGDSVTEARARVTIASARARAPLEPLALLAAAKLSGFIERDSVQEHALLSQALQLAPNDAEVLSLASVHFQIANPDSAYALTRRSVTLDPLSWHIIAFAADAALKTRRFKAVLQLADRLIARDSAREDGWGLRARVAWTRGDTLALARELDMMLRLVPDVEGTLFGYAPYAGARWSHWSLRLPLLRAKVANEADSVGAYESKLDAALWLHDHTLSQALADSMIRIATRGPRTGQSIFQSWQGWQAYAYALKGDTIHTRQALRAAAAAAEQAQGVFDGDPRLFASAFALVRSHTETVVWLERCIRKGYGFKFLSIDPRLEEFRRTDAWRTFAAAHAGDSER